MTAVAPPADLREALLDARSAALARRGAVDKRAASTRPFLVCACGADRYGLPMEAVARVMAARACVALPGAPTALVGLAAVSGRLVSVLDLALALGASAGAGLGHFVVLRGGETQIALAVDRVLGVAEAAAAEDGGELSSGFGADAVSGYAATGAGADVATGFVVIDPRSLVRRFLA